ncbi:MAG: sigma-54-dependent Fis family transcriptional regulator [Acidobacteria bacterium]|nr:MAG: sigma-54-dependent Fis family transcriptional regulator [Acidobacteriota bacterium]
MTTDGTPEAPGRADPGRVLIVDDERGVREVTAHRLKALGHEVDDVGSLAQAAARVHARPYDVVLTDLMLADGTGIDLLEQVKADGLDVEVIIMTGRGGVEDAVRAIRRGAYDFITKPLDRTRLELVISKALEKRRLERDLARLSRGERDGFGDLVGSSAPMQALYRVLEKAAESDSTVLLLGESGTGKEVAARAIHERSKRRGGPFVPVHCGALPRDLLESELFGHRRGAFTGADRDKRGLIAAADGGTLFLDELGTAPPALQVKLLRVLQEHCVRPLGGVEDVKVDVRVIAATNADLDAEIEAGRFRSDLYFRLATVVVRLPPLREHREDIPLMVGVLCDRIARRTGRAVRLSPRAVERLMAYDWPGNVRELEHVIERAALLCDGPLIRARDLPLDPPAVENRIPTLEELEREHIERVLKLCGGNKLKAARLLGIPRGNLYRRLQRYGIGRDGSAGGAEARTPGKGVPGTKPPAGGP